jgi:hypothetical protein
MDLIVFGTIVCLASQPWETKFHACEEHATVVDVSCSLGTPYHECVNPRYTVQFKNCDRSVSDDVRWSRVDEVRVGDLLRRDLRTTYLTECDVASETCKIRCYPER